MRLSKRDCCCGRNMGKGWGPDCMPCPITGSHDYMLLCRERFNATLDIRARLDHKTLDPGMIVQQGKEVR